MSKHDETKQLLVIIDDSKHYRKQISEVILEKCGDKIAINTPSDPSKFDRLFNFEIYSGYKVLIDYDLSDWTDIEIDNISINNGADLADFLLKQKFLNFNNIAIYSKSETNIAVSKKRFKSWSDDNFILKETKPRQSSNQMLLPFATFLGDLLPDEILQQLRNLSDVNQGNSMTCKDMQNLSWKGQEKISRAKVKPLIWTGKMKIQPFDNYQENKYFKELPVSVAIYLSKKILEVNNSDQNYWVAGEYGWHIKKDNNDSINEELKIPIIDCAIEHDYESHAYKFSISNNDVNICRWDISSSFKTIDVKGQLSTLSKPWEVLYKISIARLLGREYADNISNNVDPDYRFNLINDCAKIVTNIGCIGGLEFQKTIARNLLSLQSDRPEINIIEELSKFKQFKLPYVTNIIIGTLVSFDEKKDIALVSFKNLLYKDEEYKDKYFFKYSRLKSNGVCQEDACFEYLIYCKYNNEKDNWDILADIEPVDFE